MKKLPEIGKRVTYFRDTLPCTKTATFTVVNVDVNTGCIYLVADNEAEARAALTHRVKIKNDKEVDALAFAWMPQLQQYAVNVEWDAWQLNVVLWRDLNGDF